MKHFLAGLAILAAMPLSGCATILTGTTQDVRIVSDPPGAQVRVDGRLLEGKTPVTVNLQRGALHRMELSLEGHEDSVGVTRSSFNGWVLLGGLVTFVIDVASGAYQWISPNEYRFIMEPKSLAPAAARTRLNSGND
jgi:hypothetical protein